MTKAATDLENAVSRKGEIFYARHMQPGTCRYHDETILVDTDAMKKMLTTGTGIPVYLHHQDVDFDTMKQKAVGYVTDSFYNELDGWGWFKFLALDDEARNAIGSGWHVSNAYRPTMWGDSGTKNNVPYDRRVLDGEFTHLAIVPDPRYEDARILSASEFNSYQASAKEAHRTELQNSKGRKMFKLTRNKKEEVTEIDAETEIELQNGKTVKVADMVAQVEAAQAEELRNQREAAKLDQEVEVAGKKMPLKDLVSKFELLNAKKNADDDKDDKENDDEDKEDKENEDEDKDSDEDGDMKNKKKKSKKNSRSSDDDTPPPDHFDELRNAHFVEAPQSQIIETASAGTRRGLDRYGSGAKA